MHTIEALHHISDFRLRLYFDGGEKREIDLGSYLNGELLGPLRLGNEFSRACVNAELGTVVWPNGASIDPSWLFEQSVPVEVAPPLPRHKEDESVTYNGKVIPFSKIATYVGANQDDYLPKFCDFLAEDGSPQYSLTWHWPAFILPWVIGPVWTLHRKMYLWTIPFAVLALIPIIGWIASGVLANYVYFRHVTKKIARMSPEELADDRYLRIRGGTTWLAPILGLMSFPALIIIVLMLIPA